jgi:hypothetical protein
VALLPDKLLTPEGEELERKKASLAELEAQLAARELERASVLADLVHFEKRYLQMVGRRYALLDELRAKIAESRAQQNPHQQDACDQARQARSKAQESARAIGEETAGLPSPDDGASPSKPNRSESLRNLYCQAAKLFHPDLTLDGEEKKRRHRLMGEINEAYARGDEERMRAILCEWHAAPESVQGDGPGAELVRVIRKIAQVEKRLKTIVGEMDQLRQGELFNLKQAVEEAHANGRELLKEVSEQLDRKIAQAAERTETDDEQRDAICNRVSYNSGNLVPAAHSELAHLAAANPLVLRGFEYLAKTDSLPKPENILGGEIEILVSLVIELASLKQKMLKDKIERVLKTLTYREREIIKHRYGLAGLTFTYEEIGRFLNLTPDGVRQIEEKAVRKLQHPHRSRMCMTTEQLSAQDQAILAKPVAELNLSRRTRKCLDRLRINSLGDLVSHTADELLITKNFGITCLTEVREELRQFGLMLGGSG